jgi:hypothetical protein
MQAPEAGDMNDGVDASELEGMTGAGPVSIFISYRSADTTPGTAQLLRDELTRQDGTLANAHVFVDDAIPEGDDWWATIAREIDAADIVIALIGVRWLELARQKASSEDVVRRELRLALRSDCRLVPILVDDAKMPDNLEGLPSLSAKDALLFRHQRRQDDMNEIIARLSQIGKKTSPKAEPEPAVQAVPAAPAAPVVEPVQLPVPPDHFQNVMRALSQGKLVVCLGWDLAAPLTDQNLAAQLADRAKESFLSDDYVVDSRGLAQVAQHLSLTAESELFEAMRNLLKENSTPSAVHKFLASFSEPPMMIVTANYDTALEDAFDEKGIEFDLAIYMARGEHRGKFLHVDPDGDVNEAFPANGNNFYSGFPFDTDGVLQRPLIVKIHGAVDNPRAAFPENYVVTENDYIDFLAGGSLAIPNQILVKLMRSYVLFLGYSLADWNLRVFVHRVWSGGFKNESWAVAKAHSPVERRFWDGLARVQFFDVPVETYVQELRGQLTRSAPERAAP